MVAWAKFDALAMDIRNKHPLLIVDDEPEVLNSLRSLFRRHYTVLMAERPDAALNLLKEKEVHVIISDQRMPGMNGTEFLTRVRDQHPDVIRLMMTGYTDINSVIEAINRGHIYRYISKPWDTGELEVVVRQATEQYELLTERKRLLRELEEANQLKANFITIASHEFNTPLTVVMGMLQLALGRSMDATTKDYLERSLRAAERLHKRLANIFKLLQEKDFRRSLERAAVPIERLFQDVVLGCQPFLLLRKQQVEIEVSDPQIAVAGSPSHLRDVMENLLANAIKFSRDEATIRLRGTREGNRARLEIIDNGVGISTQDQPHVFEPLFSSWDAMHHSTGDYGFCKRGMGLGLAVAKRFVEMHGGEISFQSTPDVGTTFSVWLPVDG